MSEGGEGVVKLAKAFAVVACAGLLLAGVMSSARQAFAQQGEVDSDQGYWSAGSADADSAAELSPESKIPPLEIDGCWSGIAGAKTLGVGDAFFNFNQDGKKLLGKNTSLLEFSWAGPPEKNAEGPLSGKVTSKGFKFKGSAGKGCNFKGDGEGNASVLTGKIKFSGKCAKTFEDVTFSVNPQPCSCL
jgi:hypothetical protein